MAEVVEVERKEKFEDFSGRGRKSSSGFDEQQQIGNRNLITPKSARRAESRSPVKCVCDLCDCGSHNCSSLILRPAEKKGHQQPTAEDNRWRQEEMLNSDGEGEGEEEANGMGQCGCFQSGEQRFLTQSPSRNILKSTEPELNEQNREQDPELLHILVTRPQIASKPRDNILFEGDMDLKTTFETSYEALAKMRLDQWRKFQDCKSLKRGSGDKQQLNPIKRPADAIDPARGKLADKEVSVKQAGNEKRGSQTRQRSARDSDELAGERIKMRAPAPTKDGGSSKSNQQKQRQLKTAESRNDQLHGEAPPVGASKSSIKLQKGTNEMLSSSSPSAQTPSPMPIKITKDDFIDPDLSSIIVYDANMNRLEKVGVRKRSKYRPSTSLKSGSRGLFGDQEELKWKEEERGAGAGGYQVPELSPAQANPPEAHTLRAKPLRSPQRMNSPSEAREQVELKRNLNKTHQGAGLVFSDKNLHVESKRRVNDNVNMTDHMKEQNIVGDGYEGCIPPTQASFVDEHDPAQWSGGIGREKLDTNLQPVDDVPQAADGDYELMVRENMENVKIVDQEEEEAVREIQRVTGDSVVDRSQNRAQITIGAPVTPNFYNSKSPTDSSKVNQSISRQSGNNSVDQSHSKLKRTCQNQNFYLYENDYPKGNSNYRQQENSHNKTPEEGMSATNRNAQASPNQSQTLSRLSYNNLFRESPDFILTTGKFIELEAKNLTKPYNATTTTSTTLQPKTPIETNTRAYDQQQQTSKGLVRLDQRPFMQEGDDLAKEKPSMEDDNYGENEELTREACDCRVLKLNEDFRYVGSQMGHKYFVEKQISKSMLDYD